MPAILRAIVACGWFGIQSWIGGQAIHAMLVVVWPGVAAVPWSVWACFLGFWALNMVVVWRGVESIRFLQGFSAPFMLVMSLLLLVFALRKAGGFGPMLSEPSQFPIDGSVSALLLSVADGDGGLLGDAGAEHSGLHALLEVAALADRGAGVRIARCDDAVLVHRRSR